MIHLLWLFWLHRPHGLALGWFHHHHAVRFPGPPPPFCTPDFTVCTD